LVSSSRLVSSRTLSASQHRPVQVQPDQLKQADIMQDEVVQDHVVLPDQLVQTGMAIGRTFRLLSLNPLFWTRQSRIARAICNEQFGRN
jgi:hypothetical protein